MAAPVPLHSLLTLTLCAAVYTGRMLTLKISWVVFQLEIKYEEHSSKGGEKKNAPLFHGNLKWLVSSNQVKNV